MVFSETILRYIRCYLSATHTGNGLKFVLCSLCLPHFFVYQIPHSMNERILANKEFCFVPHEISCWHIIQGESEKTDNFHIQISRELIAGI